ncbi:MAG: right-handed parallel beta-helix repeat-containing protein, partial [Opitutaceae bacterium]
MTQVKNCYHIAHAVTFAFLGIFIVATHVFGFTSYYISSAGSDANNGTSTSTPWRTISKANSITFTAGDVVSFRSGDIFYGQITINQPGLTFQSYNSGAKAVITGGVSVTGWSVYSGSIYVATASSFVKNLFSNGMQMTVARYPNTGFMAVGSTNGSTTLTSASMNQSSGYWNGGKFHIRSVPWQYETRSVSSYDGSTLTLSSGPDYPILTGWGFYLDNTLAALDAAGEWYCDPSTNKVYFYAPGGVNPASLSVTGSVLDYGLVSSQSNSTIQNLAFQYQASAAVHFSGSSSNVSILSNIIYGQWCNGVEFAGSHSYCTIDGNTFQNINGRGVDLNSPSYFTVTNNTLKSIGLFPGYGISGVSGMIAIYSMEGGHNVISRNIIDSVGCIGIRYDGSYNRIENNVLTNTMLRTSDGGAIYAQNYYGDTQGSTIRNNIIENVTGYALGTASPYAGETNGYGIYFDDACISMVADGNTIIHAQDAAIYSHDNSGGMIMRNNTLYECGSTAGNTPSYFLYQGNSSNPGFVFNHNIVYPPAVNKPFIVLLNPSLPASVTPGAIDSNYYFNPYNTTNNFLSFNTSWSNYTFYTFASWKSFTGLETHSTMAAGTGKVLFTNKTSSTSTVTLSPTSYKDVNGVSVSGSMTLQPYSSRLLFIDYSIPLPVELVSFTMAIVNGGIVLNWKTATEVGNYGFDVEKIAHGSGPDTLWTKIGFVAGNGTSNTSHT